MGLRRWNSNVQSGIFQVPAPKATVEQFFISAYLRVRILIPQSLYMSWATHEKSIECCFALLLKPILVSVNN